MNNILRWPLLLAIILPVTLLAGGLFLEVGNPQANPEAIRMHAMLLARITACHEPAKSVVSANLVELSEGNVRRTPLKVVALSTPGTFAVLGSIPAGSSPVIELSVVNPEYKNYSPHALVRAGENGVQWTTLKRFSNNAPTAEDVKAVFAANTAVPSGS